MSCSAVFCPSRTTKGGVKDPELSFHTFPKCPEIRSQWIKAVRRDNWEPTAYSRLCSKHFENCSFVAGLSIRKLKTDAVPTIFEGYPKYYQPPGKDLANYYCYKENNTNPKLKSTAKFRYLTKSGRATSLERSPSPPTTPEKILKKSLQKAFLRDQPLLSARKKQKTNSGSIASRQVKKQAKPKIMNEYNNACRCCLLKMGPMKPIFGSSLDVMLTDLMGFQIKPNDGYPQQVCNRCIRKLSSAHNFLLTVNKSHTTVEEILKAAKKTIYPRNNIKALSAVKVAAKGLKTESKAVSCQTEEEYFQKLMLANVQLSRIERDSRSELSDTDYVMLSETEDTEQLPEDEVSKIKSETKTLPELKYVQASKVGGTSKALPELKNAQKIKLEKTSSQSPERKNIQLLAHETPKVVRRNVQETLKQSPEKKHVSKAQKSLKRSEGNYVQVSKVQSNTSKLLPEKMNVEVYESYEDVPDTKYGYKCPQCLHIANSQADLKEHVESHLAVAAEPSEVDCAEETPAQLCNICGQTFKCRTSLYKHLRFHRGQVFECKFCAKPFAEASALKIHLVRHSSAANSQPFDCSACDRTFTQKSALAKHVRAMHSLQRAVHQCTLCDKTFLYKYSLNKHCLRHHSSSRCSLCDSQFSGIIALEAHMKKHKENDIFETEYLELDEL